MQPKKQTMIANKQKWFSSMATTTSSMTEQIKIHVFLPICSYYKKKRTQNHDDQ